MDGRYARPVNPFANLRAALASGQRFGRDDIGGHGLGHGQRLQQPGTLRIG